MGRSQNLVKNLVITLPWVFIALWVHGKRHIVAFFLALFTWRLWERGYLKGVRLPIAALLVVVLFGSYSVAYQAGVRSLRSNVLSKEERYEDLRIDFGRDHTIRCAIYAELNDGHILDVRGKSLQFYGGLYIPRAWWPDKPYAYGVYMTCYAAGMKPQLLHWALTTSIFDEAIANAGWWGMLIGPVLLGLLCRLADRTQHALLRIVGLLTCLLFLATNLSAFEPLFILWFFGSLFERCRGFFTLRLRRYAIANNVTTTPEPHA